MRDWPDDPTAVRPGDLAAAVAVVSRFRRRRRATLAAALSVAVVATLSSRAFEDVRHTSLVPADSPPVTVPPDGTAPRPTRAPAPSAPAPGPGDVAAPPGGSGAPALAGAPVREPGRDPAGTAPARRRPPVRAGMTKQSFPNNGSSCLAVAREPQLCTQSYGVQRKDGTIQLSYTACRATPGIGDVVLRFPTEREVDFAVVDTRTKRVLWQWSTGQRFARTNHTTTLGATDCVVWRTHWSGRLDDGTRIPKGRYRLRGAGRDTGGWLPLRRTAFDVRS